MSTVLQTIKKQKELQYSIERKIFHLSDHRKTPCICLELKHKKKKITNV